MKLFAPPLMTIVRTHNHVNVPGGRFVVDRRHCRLYVLAERVIGRHHAADRVQLQPSHGVDLGIHADDDAAEVVTQTLFDLLRPRPFAALERLVLLGLVVRSVRRYKRE